MSIFIDLSTCIYFIGVFTLYSKYFTSTRSHAFFHLKFLNKTKTLHALFYCMHYFTKSFVQKINN